jgi:transposase
MAMGKRRKRRQKQLWVEPQQLAKSPGHPFYERLDKMLDEHGFDAFVEERCAKFYSGNVGRPSLAPAVYFRLLLVGFFEGIDSERGIAWRVSDSITLRHFLGLELTDSTPDHSTISRNRRLIDLETHQAVFGWALGVLAKAGLLRGKTLGIDATTLEANAAMRSIVRRDTGESYEEFLTRLAEASGIETPTRADLARFDKKRKDKKTSNDDWQNPNDPDAKITKMKDGRTHLAHKAEHVVDMETGAIVGATIQPADRGDTSSLERTLEETLGQLEGLLDDPEAAAGLSRQLVAELVGDKGYHSNAVLRTCHGKLRTYISEPDRGRRNWRGKEAEKKAVYGNRRRIRGKRGRGLLRRRGEMLERPFAHCYDTGGMRRTHLRGHSNIRKRQLIHLMGFNLSLVLRKLFGFGTPRALQGLVSALERALAASLRSWRRFEGKAGRHERAYWWERLFRNVSSRAAGRAAMAA